MKPNIKMKPKSNPGNNFKSAFSQMMNPTNSEEELKNDETIDYEISEFFKNEDSNYYSNERIEPEFDNIEETVVEPAIFYEKTIIGPGVEISGSIYAKGDIDVLGVVKGDVVSEGNLSISGTIHGNLDANIIVINQGSIYGNSIKVTKNIQIIGATVEANIEGENIEINANVTGNLTAIESVNILQNSKFLGDVSAKRISIQEGAQIDGLLKTNK